MLKDIELDWILLLAMLLVFAGVGLVQKAKSREKTAIDNPQTHPKMSPHSCGAVTRADVDHLLQTLAIQMKATSEYTWAQGDPDAKSDDIDRSTCCNIIESIDLENTPTRTVWRSEIIQRLSSFQQAKRDAGKPGVGVVGSMMAHVNTFFDDTDH
ncbi:hypothetical protein [Neptuniibacter sp. 2_MG-2023]|uniref:hypothetical protein n=1 Tax=Neptuniibacter sp. 2_MG-2023 TaxID=3062671 RepID=UPI0026E2967D|nr:hypothetical protein [Neptuniibacter sp. 2_MG-2023]MDO6514827.1 hypothetical protein [Neptuniibacter sp. 2_MG-2023]